MYSHDFFAGFMKHKLTNFLRCVEKSESKEDFKVGIEARYIATIHIVELCYYNRKPLINIPASKLNLLSYSLLLNYLITCMLLYTLFIAIIVLSAQL